MSIAMLFLVYLNWLCTMIHDSIHEHEIFIRKSIGNMNNAFYLDLLVISDYSHMSLVNILDIT